MLAIMAGYVIFNSYEKGRFIKKIKYIVHKQLPHNRILPYMDFERIRYNTFEIICFILLILAAAGMGIYIFVEIVKP